MLSCSLSLPIDIPISCKETLQEPRRSCFHGPRPRSASLATNDEEGGVATEHLLSALVPRPHQQADQDRLAQAQRARREAQPADRDRYPGRDAFSCFEALGAA